MLKVLNLMVIGSLRSLKCVKPNYRGVWKVQIIGREGQNLARNIKGNPFTSGLTTLL